MNLRYRIYPKQSLIKWILLSAVIAIPFTEFQKASAQDSLRVSVDPIVVNQTMENGVPMVQTTHVPPAPPDITSAAAVVMDMSTGTIVYANHPLAPHYPASLTKVLTALISLQQGHLTDTLVTHADALDVPPDKLYLVNGERESLEKLLYGLLTISANDAAVVIADHYGGSVAGFARMMNQEARSLGAVHTHFVNPNGLPNDNHVTTAYDLALITRRAMQYPIFRKIVQTKYYHWHGQAWDAQLTNINHMLFNYPGAIGVKTGWTSAANQTLIAAATRHHQTFVAVLLDNPSGTDINADATSLLNYAFTNYSSEDLVQHGSPLGMVLTKDGQHIPLQLKQTLEATVLNTDKPYLKWHLQKMPTFKRLSPNQPAGWLTISDGDRLVARTPVYPERKWIPRTNSAFTLSLLTLLLLFLAVMLRYNQRTAKRLSARRMKVSAVRSRR